MKNRVFRWTVRLVAAALLALFASVTLLVGTDSGTRLVLDAAAPYLPRQLELGRIDGSLLRGLRVESLRWASATADIRVAGLAFDIELRPLFRREVAIRSLVADSLDVVLTPAERPTGDRRPLAVDLPVGISLADGVVRRISIRRENFDRQIATLELGASLDGPNLSIARLALGSDWLTVNGGGTLRLAPGYRADLAADWRYRDAGGRQFAGRLRVDGNAGAYQVDNELTVPVRVQSAGMLSTAAGTPVYDLSNRWSRLEWPAGERTLVVNEGTLLLRGNLSSAALELETTAQLGEYPVADISLQGDATRQDLAFSQLVVDTDAGRLQASGTASWRPDRQAGFEYTLSGIDAARLWARLEGIVGVAGRAELRMGDSGLVIAARIENASGEVNGAQVAGGGSVVYENGELSFEDADVRLGDSRLQASGTVGGALALAGRFDIPSLQAIEPSLAGSLAGDVTLRGERTRPSIGLTFRGEALSRGPVTLASASGTLSGFADEHAIRLEALGHGVGLNVDAVGGFGPEGWSGELGSLALNAGDFGTWTATDSPDLLAGPGGVVLSRTCLQNPADGSVACGGFDYRRDGPLEFSADVSRVPLAVLPLRLPPGVAIRGLINARAAGNLTEGRLSGSGEVRLDEAGLDTAYEDEPIAIELAEAVAEVRVTDNALAGTLLFDVAGGGGRATADLAIDNVLEPDSPIAGSSDIAFTDTALVALFAPGVSDPQGRVDGRLTASGTLARPEIGGEVAVTEASFGLAQAGIRITDFEARLQQIDTGRLRLTGSARSGRGRVNIEGNTTMAGATGLRTEVSIRGENFTVARLPDLEFTASPDIAIVLDQNAALVTGSVRIPEASISAKSLPTGAVRSSPDAVVYRETEEQAQTYRRIDVNVTTTLGDDVNLDAFGLTTGLEGSVRIQGGTRDPYLGYGRLSTRGGRYKAYGQDLRIERGELIFNGPLNNPGLDVRAVREVGEVTAGIQLSGTAQQPRSDVFSEPPLGDAETLSYLLTGRPLSAAGDTGDGDFLNQAAFALGLSQAGNVTTQIRTELGLETLAIEGGTENSRIVAGKRFGDRLLVEYGYGLVDKLGTLLLRYQLTDRLMLESRTGTVSAVDVVYSVKKQ